MSTAEHVILVQYYARLYHAHVQAVEDLEEGARRGAHFFHRRIRRSTFHERAGARAKALRNDMDAVLAEAVAAGVNREEINRWLLVERPIGVPQTFAEVLLDRS